RSDVAARPGRDPVSGAVARDAAGPERGLSDEPRRSVRVRALCGPGRGRHGVALSTREDGTAHHRHEGGHRRNCRGGVPRNDAQQARLPRPLGDPHRPVTDVTTEALYGSPNALAPHYRRFRVADRLLLTGHSHQAWPDVGFEAQQRAWLDAAEYVDDKWERAFAVAGRGQQGFAQLLDDPDGAVALGGNTDELVVRWLF